MWGASYKAVHVEDIPLNYTEVALRLGTERGYTDENIEACLNELKKVINAKFSYIPTEIRRYNENGIDFGFLKIESKDLAKNLNGCSKVFIFASTLGSQVDRLLNKLSLTSKAKYFITDALSSAMADALADYANKYLAENKKCKPRFSPGFGDLPLSVQPYVLDAVNAQKLLGISLGKSLLMSPMKSVTAIIGILDA